MFWVVCLNLHTVNYMQLQVEKHDCTCALLAVYATEGGIHLLPRVSQDV